MLKSIRLQAIGVIRTPHAEAGSCPIQPRFSKQEGTVEVFPKYRPGLRGIGQFTHIMVLYWFDRSPEEKLIARPYLERRQRGIFTIRSPHRPNHIGVSVLRLLSHRSGRLRVGNMDVLDGTPLLDIKPYIPGFDVSPGAGSGWLARHLDGRQDVKT